MSELVVDTVKAFLDGLLPDLGLELFALEYRLEGKGWVLRVYIDAEEGVSLEHCSEVSRELGQYLDVEDIIEHAYNLEVSSPGLERPLRSLDDFARWQGNKARVRVHRAIDGEKVFEGTIGAVVDEEVELLVADGRVLRFTYDMFSKARLSL
ncbi:MAG: ribosome maturation factor RimP [Deltaproteobacteria bacterium]|nr:MAG: ribosome maturation factor RimP [Deltaproteobacteria bacterium]PIE73225.1 MAG: ribosome maturation factor RimP [Deltaproteobacteria bacterium]